MSNSASSLQSTESKLVPVFINDELVMLEQSTLNALKVMAYDQGCSVEQVVIDALSETLDDPVRMARCIERVRSLEAVPAY
jgi:hypothetical protein